MDSPITKLLFRPGILPCRFINWAASDLRSPCCPQLDLFSFGGTHHEVDEEQADVRVWYTSLEEFRPLNQCFHTGKFMECYYAKSIKTGQHLVVKKYTKGTPASPHLLLPLCCTAARRL